MSAPPPRGLGAWLEQRRVQKRAARPAVLRLARPMVSFTFDGFPHSAARAGAGLLENVGARGTYYASASLAGKIDATGPMFTAADVRRLVDAGHEVGCRTWGEIDCGRIPVDHIFSDMVQNADALAALGMEARLISFAYPRGVASTALKAQLPSRFTSARGVTPGLASGAADLAQLRSNALYGPYALRRCLALLERARRRDGWVIFHTHDVSARPSPWGTPTGWLERMCGAAFTGGMRILPIHEAVAVARAECGG